MVLASLLFLLTAPTVSVQADSIRVDALLSNLSQQSGAKLICDGAIAQEPIIVQFTNQPLETVLQKIADVAGGQWTTNPKGERVLSQPPSLKRTQEAEDAAKVTAFFVELFTALKAESDKFSGLDAKRAALAVDRYRWVDMSDEDTTKELARVTIDNPAYRFAIGLLEKAGPASIAKLEVGERIVFADSQTPMQRPYPKGSGGLVAELKQSIGLMEAAKRALGNPKKQSVNYGGLPLTGPGSLAAGYGKTIVGIKRFGVLQLSYDVTTVDAKGRSVLQGSGFFPAYGLRFSAKTSGEGKPLALSHAVKTYVELRGNLGYAWASGTTIKLADGSLVPVSAGMSHAEASGKGPSQDVLTVLADPVKDDPVGVIAGSLLRQVASNKGKPLIATLSDAAVPWILEALRRKTINTDSDLIEYLQQSMLPVGSRMPSAQVSDGEWLVVKPFLPAIARKDRFSRAALRTLVQAIRRTGALSLEDAAAYIATCTRQPTFGSLDTMIIENADPASDKSAASLMYNPALPFLVKLNPSLWSALESGPVKVSALPPELRARVQRWTFGEFDINRLREQASIGKPMRSERPGGLPGFPPLETEPTELFPTGLPAGATVSLEVKRTPAVVARTESGYRLIMSAYSMAFLEQFPEGIGGGEPRPRRVIVGYTPASQRSLVLKLHLIEDIDAALHSTETSLVRNAHETTQENLPQNIRRAYDEAKKALGDSPWGKAKPPPPK
ncbi:MAG: hypothetical protein HZC36_13670 [Armatimonadetes bacterium]|nr:hypothetical protein [Armatimonadota bacterium]